MEEEVVGGEVSLLDTAEGAHKARQESQQENEYLLRPETRNLLESEEIRIPVEVEYSKGYPQEFADLLAGKNIDRSISHAKASDHPDPSPHCTDDAGVRVEELTVKNYNSSNLAVVGTSNNRGKLLLKQNGWQHLYQLGSGSGSGSSHADTAYRDTGQNQIMASGMEDLGYASYPAELLAVRSCSDDPNKVLEESMNADAKPVPGNNRGGIRTKILSKSGFSEFFVKNTLKGKGIIHRGPPNDVRPRDLNSTKNASSAIVTSDASPQLNVKTGMSSLYRKREPRPIGSSLSGVSLREWLRADQHRASKVDCLYIFRQIVELVDCSHSQGIPLHNLRPSSFTLLASKKVKYIGSPIPGEIPESVIGENNHYPENSLGGKRPLEQVVFLSSGSLKKKKFLHESEFPVKWPHLPSRSAFNLETANNVRDCNITDSPNSLNEFGEHDQSTEHGTRSKFMGPYMTYSDQMSVLTDRLEEKWYASPEELNEGGCTIYSNIYSLGILLFELLGRFDSDSSHVSAMSDLRHRILPPNFLSENPREAGFCLWLLHPESLARPTTRDILESEVISGLPEVSGELSSNVDKDDTESSLLMEFLASLREQKQKHASKLAEDVRCLNVDIREVERRHGSRKSSVLSYLPTDSLNGRENLPLDIEPSGLNVDSQATSINTNEVRPERNISQLENAYFQMRSKIQVPENDAMTRIDNDLLTARESWYLTQKDEEKGNTTDPLGTFFDGFCKYSRYSKFEVRGVLRNGDFSSSSNVICSLSFDRDEEYIAAAGVSKKIKIYEFNTLFNNSVDIHYPAAEMVNRSKLSCVCWNSYIKNYLASTDYCGVVKLWDACTGQETTQYVEHDKRAWSVDFSHVCPTKLASGGDDCSVKLWSINEKNCLGTIRNIANVCCVQFSPHSSQLLAFGSADYRTYCYDLRNTKAPWCVLGGHEKAVSYVKFLDSQTLVTASTDNTLKVWDLKRTNPIGSTNACSLTLNGHTNEKNFVGLSVSDGYIACGSETNEVYAYQRSLPMPITSHKFGSIDPISGKETEDDNGQFVSSVCWRGKSDMVVAANSSGCIKVLQMV